MIKIILMTLLFCLSSFTMGIAEIQYYLYPLKISDIDEDSETIKYITNFHAWFSSELSNYSFTPAGTTNDARVIIKGFSFYFEERVIFHINVYDRISNRMLFEDETYTSQYDSESGIKKAVSGLAERFPKKWNGEKLDVYSEYVFTESQDSNTVQTNEALPGLQSIQFVSLADLNYFYPQGLEIGVLDVFMVWLRQDNKFGIGLGSKLIDLYVNMPGYTNNAGTFLPLMIIVPLYYENEADKINDFYAVFQWAWYKPLQISDSATNTNMNNFVQNPLNYIDLRLTYYFLSFASVSCGASYFYDTGKYYFYIGASIYLGYYKKE